MSKHTHTNSSSTPMSPGIRFAIPPLVFVLCMTGAGLMHWSLYGLAMPFPDAFLIVRLVLGAGIAMAGSGIMMTAWLHFLFTGTTVTMSRPATKLVQTGAFALSRNPMYVGFVSLLFAAGVVLASWPFLVGMAIMALYLDRYIIPREETYMVAAFGSAFLAYCGRVRRWL